VEWPALKERDVGDRAMSRSAGDSAGLYVHLPFCSSICPYCDFAVMKGDAERRRRFVGTLIDEVGLCGDFEDPIDSVYFGGGTPSILEARQLGEILGTARARLPVEESARLSLEANPEDVDETSLAGWLGLGVDMLSLGVQSFSDESLAFLGREHGAREACRAVEMALAAGIGTVSIDLIYGLPGQSVEGLRRDLDTAISFRPHHLSCYQLTVHEKTVFGVRKRRSQLLELDPGRQETFFFETHERLAAAGYEGYEVSNFAVAPEHRSRHNQKYWRHAPYLGLGPSAHSFLRRRRWWNERKEVTWRRRVEAGERPIAGEEVLSTADLVFERLMLGLRTRDGVDLAEIRHAFGVDLEQANSGLLEELAATGLLVGSGTRVVPTLAGMAVADSLAVRFEIPDL
jgi:putative oxygen-independent coproporphyrinogen III oxidase